MMMMNIRSATTAFLSFSARTMMRATTTKATTVLAASSSSLSETTASSDNDNSISGETLNVAQDWDADRYDTQHSFVYQFGSSLIDLLDPQKDETILDLGCGTGVLTAKLADRGAQVRGIDADPAMIGKAQTQFPQLDFAVDDARAFVLDQPVDAVFSNAALHWVPEAERAVERIAAALKPGGRFVAEFGGKGNINTIVRYLQDKTDASKNPWFFPGIAEYSALLEKHGLEVTFASLYDRPTPLTEGESGMRNWILMFGGVFLEDLPTTEKEAILDGADDALRKDLYADGSWTADYRRIRVVAVKQGKDETVCADS